MRRLVTRAQFQAVLAGKTVSRTEHFTLHRCALSPGAGQPLPKAALFPSKEAWFGALVPKRWAKRAVTRNAIRRHIFSLANDNEFDWPDAAHLVRLRSAFDRKIFESASSGALSALVKAELRVLLTDVSGATKQARQARPGEAAADPTP